MDNYFDKAEQYYDACLKSISKDNLTLAYLPIVHLAAECYLSHILTTLFDKKMEEIFVDNNGNPSKHNIPHDLNVLYDKIFEHQNAKDYLYYKRAFKFNLLNFSKDFKHNRFLTPNYIEDLSEENLYADYDFMSDCRDMCEKFLDKYNAKQEEIEEDMER